MVAEQDLFSLAMTTLQQEDLDNFRRDLIERMQIRKEDAEGFRLHVQQELEEIRETLVQAGGSFGQRRQTIEQSLERMPDPDQFFEHMSTTEKNRGLSVQANGMK